MWGGGKEVFSIVIDRRRPEARKGRGARPDVGEHLSKPVSVEDLSWAIDKIERILEKKKLHKEECIAKYFFGTRLEKEEAKESLKEIFPKEQNESYGVMLIYFGNIFLDSMKVVENSIDNTEHKFPELQFLNVWEEHTSLVVLMMKGRRAALERFMDEFDGITKNVFRKYNREVPHSIGLGADIDDMQEVFQKCRKALTFCLVKGCDRLIRADEIHSFGMREESYPIREEKKIFSAIESWDIGEAKKWIDAFLKKVAIEDGNPEDVRHNILKLMGSMVGMAKEINLAAYRLIIERNYICRICALCTISEAREILYEIAEEVNRRKEENEVSNYIVNRTLEYVQNHFKEDVSLKKLAEVLEITPEYLSMLFKRETGMNFSIYLKEFRINYAKRLIKGTDMKVYEVARECGYSNSNYFTKVFKEVTGISPTKYH